MSNWGKVPREIVTDRPPSFDALRTFIVLSSFADKDRLCRASQQRVARELGVSRSTAQRWIRELEVAGWVKVQQWMRRSGGWAVNDYIVAPFPQVSDDAHAQARIVGNVPDQAFEGNGDRSPVTEPSVSDHTSHDAHAQARIVGIAMPKPRHERGHRDAQSQARTWAPVLRPSSSQTLSDSDLHLRSLRSRESEELEETGDRPQPQELTEEQERVLERLAWHEAFDASDPWRKTLDQLRALGVVDEEACLLLAKAWVRDPDPKRRPDEVLEPIHAEILHRGRGR